MLFLFVLQQVQDYQFQDNSSLINIAENDTFIEISRFSFEVCLRVESQEIKVICSVFIWKASKFIVHVSKALLKGKASLLRYCTIACQIPNLLNWITSSWLTHGVKILWRQKICLFSHEPPGRSKKLFWIKTILMST